jgi:hypothetical protein
MREFAGTVIFLCDFAKLRKAVISYVMHFCLSVCPHGTPWFAMDGLSRNVIFDYFSTFFPVNASFVKI